MAKKILVTGSNGFVGRRLAVALQAQGHHVTGTVRSRPSNNQLLCDFSGENDYSQIVEGQDWIVHCAARVHQMQDTASDPVAAFAKVNTDATLSLAQAAANAGVKRFVFVSTAKVCGESSQIGCPLREDIANETPDDPYAISKKAAEIGLRKLAEQTGMEVVVIRPPLVYGPGVKANFAALMNWVGKGLPLPLGAVDNSRSFIFIDNLIDVICLSLTHHAAANRTFLVSDDDDVSTTDLLKQLAVAMGKPSRLIPVPPSWLLGATRLLGRPQIGERLCGSLQLDIRQVKEALNWTPPFTMQQGLEQMMSEISEKS
ncbi:NAD-dependent epimerase/dehydratase family protein [Photobacterium aquae]|uniref:NAD-dependent epimerase/dehydratase family protein n=1 Tax=Photobacterium aquae TaxID=1195763 RepID=UPI000B0D088F|nr:NAD-dependent epimerase/dehydratase family protein [Photobacterium aquae]